MAGERRKEKRQERNPLPEMIVTVPNVVGTRTMCPPVRFTDPCTKITDELPDDGGGAMVIVAAPKVTLPDTTTS